MKLLIATPCFGGLLHSDYICSLLTSLRILHNEGISCAVHHIKNESCIGRARNSCATFFLQGDFTHLLFIDADQVWLPQDILRIVRSKRTLVGGCYPKKDYPIDLNFTPQEEHAAYFPGGAKPPELFAEYAKLADAEGEIPVQHLATGFMLIAREVFEALKPGCPTYSARQNQHDEHRTQWDFFPAGVMGGYYQTEDFSFCSQAREAGHPPYLNVHVVVDHIGSHTYQMPSVHRVGAGE